MRFPPIRNATLTEVRSAGGSEDYDQAATQGTVKWSGSEGVFVNDEAVSDDAGERTSIVIERSVVVDDALAVSWTRGDVLAYTFREAALSGIVRDVKVTTAPGLPGVIRLVLRDA